MALLKKKKKTEPRWGFHGEVLFEERALPKGTEITKTNVLQGSTTPGHEHVVKKGTFEIRKASDDRLFLVAKNGVIVGMSQATERHNDVKIPNDTTWEICRAIETDHFAGVIRSVCD